MERVNINGTVLTDESDHVESQAQTMTLEQVDDLPF